ncbi:hypothetical protein J4429_02055 [Candidatus Pacearchaeota archaeon]|nr:hypothetical protein [Candidatus Pacearchaeota archaeon]
MGEELTNVVVEGQMLGETRPGGTKFILSSQLPRQGVLASYSEKGIPQNEHEIELQRQMAQLLDGPGLFLFNKFTHYFGDRDTPNVGIRTFLEYKSILP